MDEITITPPSPLFWMVLMTVMLISISVGENDIGEESLLDMSPFLPYIAGPPNNGRFSYSPQVILADPKSVAPEILAQRAFASFFRTPLLFGFPVEVEKIRNLMAYCHLNKNACEEGNSTAAILSILNFVSSPCRGFGSCSRNARSPFSSVRVFGFDRPNILPGPKKKGSGPLNGPMPLQRC